MRSLILPGELDEARNLNRERHSQNQTDYRFLEDAWVSVETLVLFKNNFFTKRETLGQKAFQVFQFVRELRAPEQISRIVPQ